MVSRRGSKKRFQKSRFRPVYIGHPINMKYPSIQLAADMLGTTPEHIKRMVRDGFARFL